MLLARGRGDWGRCMAILGAHMSIAGGYFKAVEAAHRCGCDCVQLFTKNNNQWRAKEISQDDVMRFRTALKELRVSHPIAHDSYLINLASPDNRLWKRSIAAFIDELKRCEMLGLDYLVAHPGAHIDSGELEGIGRIAEAIDLICQETGELRVKIALETTAGQGTTLGYRFEQLRDILGASRYAEWLTICLDTCHVFSA